MSRWLAVREEWHDVRYGASGRSGGYVVGYLVLRTALAWVEAASKREAQALAPFGTTAVLSYLSLDAGDRDGWLRMPLGVCVETRVPLFDSGRGRELLEKASAPRDAQLRLEAA